MNKLQLWFTIAILFFSAIAFAQKNTEQTDKTTTEKRTFLECISIGGRGGVGFNSMRYSNASLRKYDPSIFALENYGVFVEFRLSNHFFLRPEFIWMKRGQKIDDRGVYYKLASQYYDIRLPLLFRFGNDNWKVQPYVMAAPVMGIANGGSIRLDDRQIGITDASLKEWNFGAQLGGGMKVPFRLGNFAMEFGIEASYHLGLSDTYSNREKDGSAIALNQSNYRIDGTRMNRGIETSALLAIPLSNFRRKKERPSKASRPEKTKPVKVEIVPEAKPQPVKEVSLPVCDYFKIDGLGYFVTDGYNLPNRNISVNGLYFGLDRKAPTDTAASDYMKRMTRIIRKSRFVHIDLLGEPIEKFMVEHRNLRKQVDELQRLCDSLLHRPSEVNMETDTNRLNPDLLLRYEIQVCVMSTPLKNSILNGRQMRMEKTNDRYSYSLDYPSRAEAENALPGIVKKFPDAYIRTQPIE